MLQSNNNKCGFSLLFIGTHFKMLNFKNGKGRKKIKKGGKKGDISYISAF
jgi:hypothetical protein